MYVLRLAASVSIETSPNTQLLKKTTGASGWMREYSWPNVPADAATLLSGFGGHESCHPFSNTTGGRLAPIARCTKSGSTVTLTDSIALVLPAICPVKRTM